MNSNLSKLSIALLATLSVLFISGSVEQNGMFSDETAAWVQAIGSIAAVVGAAWIAGHGLREQRRQEADAVRRAAEAEQIQDSTRRIRAAALIRVARHRIEILQKHIKNAPEETIGPYYIESVTGAFEAMSKFRYDELSPRDAIISFAKAETVCRMTAKHVANVKAHSDKSTEAERREPHESLAARLEDVCKSLDDTASELEAL